MKFLQKIIIVLAASFNFLLPQLAMAQTNLCEDGVFKPFVVCGRSQTSSCAGTQACTLADIPKVMGNIVYNVLLLLMMLVPIFIMYLGIQMILQHGVPKQLNALKEKLLWTVLLLIIILGSWLIVREVVKAFNVSSDVPSFLLDENGNPVSNPGPSIK